MFTRSRNVNVELFGEAVILPTTHVRAPVELGTEWSGVGDSYQCPLDTLHHRGGSFVLDDLSPVGQSAAILSYLVLIQLLIQHARKVLGMFKPIRPRAHSLLSFLYSHSDFPPFFTVILVVTSISYFVNHRGHLKKITQTILSYYICLPFILFYFNLFNTHITNIIRKMSLKPYVIKTFFILFSDSDSVHGYWVTSSLEKICTDSI